MSRNVEHKNRIIPITLTLSFVALALVASHIWNNTGGGGEPTPTPTPTSVLQPYFDAVATDTSKYGGECVVNPDCMPPDVCVGTLQGDVMVGSCMSPQTPTPPTFRVPRPR